MRALARLVKVLKGKVAEVGLATAVLVDGNNILFTVAFAESYRKIFR